MTDTHLGIKVDYSRDSLFDINGLTRIRESYMLPEESSPQQRLAAVSKAFSSDDKHAQRLYDYASKHWLSYSTPILSYGKSGKGLPISCFLAYIPDTAKGLIDNLSETNWLSMAGGGVGIGFGIRSSDDKSTGVMAHMKIYDASSLAYRQGKTRRGSYAAYLDISHPDIIQFLEMRKPTGDPNIRCPNMHHAINITDDFMNIIKKCESDSSFDDSWPLIDPHSKKTITTVSARNLWQRILETRMQTGEPYIHFIDTANAGLPDFLKNKGLKIRQSNLCQEIELATDDKRTAVCCLSSLNLDYFDDWKDNQKFYDDVAEMLDNVLTRFIEDAPKEVERARYSAMMERSIGIGTLAFHSYLQSKNIAFEGLAASMANNLIFKTMRERLDKSNKALGSKLGSPPDLEGTGLRFAHLMAIAPNATSSIIMGNTSPSIEPFRANAYRQDTLSGSFLNKNKHLDAVIKSKIPAEKYEEVWSSIISHDGSVQHLSFLSEEEKAVFKTAIEIDQRWIVEHASVRQKYIDQGQSVNLFFRPDVNVVYLHAVHRSAWEKGLKGLYYCRSEKIKKADKVARAVERKAIKEIERGEEGCLACE